MQEPAALPGFTMRLATAADSAVLAHHRCAMFLDMGSLQAAAEHDLAVASAGYFAAAIPAGAYVAWVAAPVDQPARIVAGAGLLLRRTLPRPDRDGRLLREGRQGLVGNVYTEPAWRRRGLAEALMHTLIAWARAEQLAGLVLHASSMGRPLYERLGFEPTNEMYFPL